MIHLSTAWERSCVPMSGSHRMRLAVRIASSSPTEPKPVAACVLLDTSGSMAGPPLDRARVLIGEAIAGAVHPDWLAIVGFSSGASLLLDWTAQPDVNADSLRAALDGVEGAGITRMDRAAGAAWSVLRRRPPGTQVLTWMITDGCRTDRLGRGTVPGRAPKGAELVTVVSPREAVAESGASVSDVGWAVERERGVLVRDAELHLEVRPSLRPTGVTRIDGKLLPSEQRGSVHVISLGHVPQSESVILVELECSAGFGIKRGKNLVGSARLVDSQSNAVEESPLNLEWVPDDSTRLASKNDEFESMVTSVVGAAEAAGGA